MERLSAQMESLRADAEAYARFRDQLGAIECEARRRAVDLEEESRKRTEAAEEASRRRTAALEEETGTRLRRLADQFQAQYRTLMEGFETTAAHVNSELRKIEVNLTQLPRAMDQSDTELKELEALLERQEKEENRH